MISGDLAESADYAVPDLSRDPPRGQRPCRRGKTTGVWQDRSAGDRTAIAGLLRPAQHSVTSRWRTCLSRPCVEGDATGQNEPGPAAGFVLPMPRCNRDHAGGKRRRSHGPRRPRRHQLPGVSRAARPEDAGVVRVVPSEDVELRAGRREDGHHVQFANKQSQHSLGQVCGLPYQRRSA